MTEQEDVQHGVATPVLTADQVEPARNLLRILEDFQRISPPVKRPERDATKPAPEWQLQLEDVWKDLDPAGLKRSRSGFVANVSRIMHQTATLFNSWKSRPEFYNRVAYDDQLEALEKSVARLYAVQTELIYKYFKLQQQPTEHLQEIKTEQDWFQFQPQIAKWVAVYQKFSEVGSADIAGRLADFFKKNPVLAREGSQGSLFGDADPNVTIVGAQRTEDQAAPEPRGRQESAGDPFDEPQPRDALGGPSTSTRRFAPGELGFQFRPQRDAALEEVHDDLYQTNYLNAERVDTGFEIGAQADAGLALSQSRVRTDQAAGTNHPGAQGTSSGSQTGSGSHFPPPMMYNGMGANFQISQFVPKPFNGSNWEEFHVGMTQAEQVMDAMRMTGSLKYIHLRKVLTGAAHAYAGRHPPSNDDSYDLAMRDLKTYFGKGTSDLMKAMKELVERKECKPNYFDRMELHGDIVGHMTKIKGIRNVTTPDICFALHLVLWEKKMDSEMLSFWLKYKGRRPAYDSPLGHAIGFQELDRCLQSFLEYQRSQHRHGNPQRHYDDKRAQGGSGQGQRGGHQGGRGRNSTSTSRGGHQGRRGDGYSTEARRTNPTPPTRQPTTTPTARETPPRTTPTTAAGASGKVAEIKTPCPWCQQGPASERRQQHQHAYPLSCPRLKEMLLDSIVKKILKDRLCFLCTARDCKADSCPSKEKLKCTVCKEPTHNRYMHAHLKGEDPPPPYNRH